MTRVKTEKKYMGAKTGRKLSGQQQTKNKIGVKPQQNKTLNKY